MNPLVHSQGIGAGQDAVEQEKNEELNLSFHNYSQKNPPYQADMEDFSYLCTSFAWPSIVKQILKDYFVNENRQN